MWLKQGEQGKTEYDVIHMVETGKHILQGPTGQKKHFGLIQHEMESHCRILHRGEVRTEGKKETGQSAKWLLE